jgi:hypothetical protein
MVWTIFVTMIRQTVFVHKEAIRADLHDLGDVLLGWRDKDQ